MKKVCSKCGEEKELELFVKNKQCKDKREGICKDCRKIYVSKHYQQNKQQYLELRKKWRKKNPIRYKTQMIKASKVQKFKRNTNALYRLTSNIRSLIRNSIYNNGFKKHTKTHKILGCSFDKFKQYLESQFQEGMTWDNYGRGGWHIDHIYPVSKARDEQHLLELNHYTNLQPLWEKDNLAKGNKIISK